MKKSIFRLLAITLITGFSQAETANELAEKIIKSQHRFGYNAESDSQKEIAYTYAMNSELRLNWLMVNDKSVKEELRICYALQLLNEKIRFQEKVRSGITPLPLEELMMKQRLILGKRLSILCNAKKAVVDPSPSE